MFSTKSWFRTAVLMSAASGAFGQAPYVHIGAGATPCGGGASACSSSTFFSNTVCARQQILVAASELAGAVPGAFLTSLAFNVTIGSPHVWSNLQISIGHSAIDDFAPFGNCNSISCPFGWLGGLSVVRAPAPWLSGTGWSTIPFDTPFVWNGVDALVVDIEWSQPPAAVSSFENLGWADGSTFPFRRNARGYVSYFDSSPCPVAGPRSAETFRPEMRLGLCANAVATQVGVGCSDGNNPGPTLSGTPPLAGQLGVLTISGAAPGAGGVLFLGAAGGPIPLPGGCFFRLADPFVFQFLFTDLGGSWSYSSTIPNAPGVQADLQALLFPAGGSPLFQTTNALHLVIGC